MCIRSLHRCFDKSFILRIHTFIYLQVPSLPASASSKAYQNIRFASSFPNRALQVTFINWCRDHGSIPELIMLMQALKAPGP